MSTLRQIEANRLNALKSTGPTSAMGKAAASMNAFKNGIHAKSLVLPFENPGDLQQLTEECYRHYNPATPEARSFVDDFIRCEWILRRLDNAETQAWRYQNEDKYRDKEKYPLGKSVTCNPNSFSKLQYRVDATRRARDRALLALERLAAKAAAPPPDTPPEPDAPAPELHALPQNSTQIGFVPSPPVPASPGPPDTLWQIHSHYAPPRRIDCIAAVRAWNPRRCA
jgi:hypothetical protein